MPDISKKLIVEMFPMVNWIFQKNRENHDGLWIF